MTTKAPSIEILGTTLTGDKFRPSDWAQRLTVAIATVAPKKKIIYHPRVHTALRNGVPAVIIDPELQMENIMLFEFLINFARGNKLQIINCPEDI